MRPDLEKEFLACYDEHADAIYRHCFFRVFSKSLAEELTQEAFLKTWEYLDKGGKKVENLRAFVYRVANNLVIDHSRKKKEENLEALLEQSPAHEPSEDAGADIERGMLAKDVLRVIGNLPEDERRLIIMRYVDELDPREIAEALDISPNHASVKLNRAMKSLRAILGDTLKDEHYG